MQRDLRRDSEGLEAPEGVGDGGGPPPPLRACSGVWGSCGGVQGLRSTGAVTDEDLQAQAWLPNCLSHLLCEVSPPSVLASCL